MHPPVLFLDIDGVLVACPEGEHTAPQFTPCCVEALKIIIQAVPGLQIVFSTTWRLPPHVDRLHDEWRAHGLPVAIARDGTPDTRDDAEVSRFLRRGLEIAEWLEAHPDVTRWVVVDDERMGIEPVLGIERCVFTDPRRGLTVDEAARAIGILSASFRAPEATLSKRHFDPRE